MDMDGNKRRRLFDDEPMEQPDIEPVDESVNVGEISELDKKSLSM